MQILLAAATEMEITPFVKEHPSADILVTGVGAPATIYHLTKRLHLMDYDLVIQAGIAGTFDHSMELGSVVSVKSDTFADSGIRTSKGFSTIFEEGLADPEHHPYKNGWLVNENPLLEKLGFPVVNGITVNTITEDAEINKLVYAKFNAEVETMEGACLHYVCLNAEVPFLQIRTISNYIGERDKSNWRMDLAITSLNKQLILIYERLLHDSI